MLVVDFHALQPVDILNFLDQVSGQRLYPKDAQNIMRYRAAIKQQIAFTHHIALIHRQWTTLWQQIFNGIQITIQWHYTNTPLGFVVIAKLNPPFGLGNHRKIFWPTCFEQLGNPRQTTCDIAGL